ncbi:MAG: thiamine pyrophosphate-dependent enzyme, partial [Pseudomonadota bacterium]
QAEAYHWPIDFFTPKTWHIRRPAPDALELQQAVTLIAKAKRPIIIAGGGVRYSGAHAALQDFAEAMKIPVAVTQAGKSTILDHHPLAMGAIGVTGSSVANHLAEQADLVLAVGTRLQDFTSGSNGLFKGALLTLNVQLHDASKHRATPLVCDAKAGLLALIQACGASRLGDDYLQECDALKSQWRKAQAQAVAAPSGNSLPSDGQVIGAVARNTPDHAIIIGAAGSMPGELHKLWDANSQDCYHMEYGFSCMGYELAAAIGVGLACPDRPGIVFVGDGSYLMMNSELITAVLMGIRVTVIVTDNHGFGCIHRLQAGTGGAAFNNLFIDCKPAQIPRIDFVQHARSMGARAHRASSIADLERMVAECVEAPSVDVIVIETNPEDSTEAGGSWWDVAIPEVSPRPSVERASAAWRKARTSQHKGYR